MEQGTGNREQKKPRFADLLFYSIVSREREIICKAPAVRQAALRAMGFVVSQVPRSEAPGAPGNRGHGGREDATASTSSRMRRSWSSQRPYGTLDRSGDADPGLHFVCPGLFSYSPSGRIGGWRFVVSHPCRDRTSSNMEYPLLRNCAIFRSWTS